MLPKETAPAIVTCPPTFISPDTDTSPSNVALPTIVTVDAKFAAPPTDTVSFKCVDPDTLNVPPTTALATDILPVIGIPVIFVPSP